MHRNSRALRAEDGTRIAWDRVGEGPPLVFANGFTTSNFFWKRVLPRLAERASCITWDYKGHGDSEPARTRAGTRIEAAVDDMRRVMDAAGVEAATLVGFSMGCQVVLEAWRHLPERIDALVTILGPYRAMLDTAFHPRIGGTIHWLMRHAGDRTAPLAMDVLSRVMLRPWSYELGQKLDLVGPVAPREDIRDYVEHFTTLDPVTVREMGLHAAAHTAGDLLHTIRVPTLIVSGEHDVFAPSFLGDDMAAAIPGADLVRLPDGTHTSLFEHPDVIVRAVETFLLGHGLLGTPGRQTPVRSRASSSA